MNGAILQPALVIALVLAGALHQAAGAGRTGARRPNIVILVADDIGYGELGCQGNREIPTPHIDSIAANGVRFTNGYVTAPFCSPSRAGLLTGRYQTRFGYEFNPIGFGFLHEGHYFVPPPYHGVTTMLRRRTLPDGGQGRWTSDDGRMIYSTHMGHNEPAYDADNPILRSGQPVDESEYLTDAFTREAVEFIGRHRDRPFFLYVAYSAVHSPLQGADAYMQRMAGIPDIHRRIFAAMLSNLDDSVGEILQKLQDEELHRDTLVFFLSDNGGPTRELTSSNHPLRGGKGDVYEGGIRVPFLVQWMGRIPAGRVYDPPVISLDLFPTAAAAAGTAPPAGSDGVDLLPFLTGQDSGRPHDILYWRVGHRTALRKGDWKLVRNARRDDAPWELYHLADDIGEAADLSEQNPEKLRQLTAEWQRLNAEMQDPS